MADYADTVLNRFVTCVYAPFSRERAMIAFVLSGSLTAVFHSLSTVMGCTISTRDYITGRNHRTSSHDRIAAACKYKKFGCHHLLMPVGVNVTP